MHPAILAKTEREVRSSGPHSNRASRHIHKDGSIIPMDIMAYTIDFHGKQCRFVTAHDVTEREALAQKLLDQQRQEAFAGFAGALMDRYEKDGAIIYSKKQTGLPLGN